MQSPIAFSSTVGFAKVINIYICKIYDAVYLLWGLYETRVSYILDCYRLRVSASKYDPYHFMWWYDLMANTIRKEKTLRAMIGNRKDMQYIFTYRKMSHALNLPWKKCTTIEMFTKKITRMRKKNGKTFIIFFYPNY